MFRFVLPIVLVLLFVPQLAASETVPNDVQTLKSQDATISQRNAGFTVDIHYPVTGYPDIDRDIRNWAEQQVSLFRTISEDPHDTPYDMSATYVITAPSERYLSIVWIILSFTGGAHGNMDIATFTYDTVTAKQIDIYDIFFNLDHALELVSRYSARVLEEKLGDMLVHDMLREGTRPDVENFSNFALTPNGIRFYFSPYQVAPWAAGMNTVDIPLNDLAGAQPQWSLWAR